MKKIKPRLTKSRPRPLQYGKDEFITILTHFAGKDRLLDVKIRRPLE